MNKNNHENGVTSPGFPYKILIKYSAPGAIIEYFKIKSVVSLGAFCIFVYGTLNIQWQLINMRLTISEHQQGESPCSHALAWFWYLIGLPAAMLHNDVRRQQLMEQMGWSSTRVHSIRAVIMEPAAVFITDISHPWLILSALHWLVIQTACIKAAQLLFLSICVDVRSPASVEEALIPDQLNSTRI